MSQDTLPLSRRQFMGAVGAGAALLSMGSAQSVAQSAITDSPPVDEVRTLDDVSVEMADGTSLSTDVYLPDVSGESAGPFPTLVKRTPYNKEYYADEGKAFARHRYAVVVQDVRGRFASEGEFTPHRNEVEDGYETVEWAAAQEWSNGKVGTYGVSYMGSTQWGLAHNDELPPHLETMVPGFAHSNYYLDSVFAGGALLLSHTLGYNHGLAIDLIDGEGEGLSDLEKAYRALQQLYWDLPVDPYVPMEEAGYSFVDEKFDNETYSDDHWGILNHASTYEDVDVPVLNYGGWYDIYTQGTVKNFRGLREEATGPGREASELVMGPYTHADPGSRAQGLVTGGPYEFPANSTIDEMALQLSWFDRVLKEDESTAESPPVRVYVPGLDEWVGADDFPLPGTEFTKYYLHSDGNANIGDITDTDYEYEGVLSPEETLGACDGAADEYTYDPADPVVSVGGYNLYWRAGIADRATAYQNRDDILVYDSAVLEEDVAVVGPVTATLYASTSAVDTDFVVTLSDVDPGETAGSLLVAEGARRGRVGDVSADPRAAETYTEVNELEPGEVYEWKIAVWPTARVFEAGHQIRVDVTSSEFPRYNRNLNTGEGLSGEEMVEAEQTVHHTREYPSHVELPIVPVSELEEMVIDGPVPGAPNGGTATE